MNKILIAGLVGGVVSFLLGWLLYGVALSGVMQAQSTANVMRADDQMVWWALVLGNLSYGMLFAYIFGRWAGISNWMSGATAGATIGLLMALYFDFVMYATADLMTLQGGVV